MQMVLKGKMPNEMAAKKENHADSGNDQPNDDNQKLENGASVKEEEQAKPPLTIADVPALISLERQQEKDRLLSEGFADWGRSHYTAFLKASTKYGRDMYLKIAPEVGKTQGMVEEYASAFWDPSKGKRLFSETEYDRVVKRIEQGEKKLQTVKVLETATETFVSLFDNPWLQLEFTYVNMKDKVFTPEEDRHLLCWAHKVSLISSYILI